VGDRQDEGAGRTLAGRHGGRVGEGRGAGGSKDTSVRQWSEAQSVPPLRHLCGQRQGRSSTIAINQSPNSPPNPTARHPPSLSSPRLVTSPSSPPFLGRHHRRLVLSRRRIASLACPQFAPRPRAPPHRPFPTVALNRPRPPTWLVHFPHHPRHIGTTPFARGWSLAKRSPGRSQAKESFSTSERIVVCRPPLFLYRPLAHCWPFLRPVAGGWSRRHHPGSPAGVANRPARSLNAKFT
jgi:hypothetical protein